MKVMTKADPPLMPTSNFHALTKNLFQVLDKRISNLRHACKISNVLLDMKILRVCLECAFVFFVRIYISNEMRYYV